MAKQTKAQKARVGVSEELIAYTDAIKLVKTTPRRSSTKPSKSL